MNWDTLDMRYSTYCKALLHYRTIMGWLLSCTTPEQLDKLEYWCFYFDSKFTSGVRPLVLCTMQDQLCACWKDMHKLVICRKYLDKLGLPQF